MSPPTISIHEFLWVVGEAALMQRVATAGVFSRRLQVDDGLDAMSVITDTQTVTPPQVNSLTPKWRHMATENLVDIVSGHGLVPDGTKP